MRILLDECVNPKLALAFPGAQVETVAALGWRALADRELLREASGKFDVFVTLDQNVKFQQSSRRLRLGVLILRTPVNDLATYRPRFSQIRDAAARLKPGQVIVLRISAGR